jgi:hypothetical protein
VSVQRSACRGSPLFLSRSGILGACLSHLSSRCGGPPLGVSARHLLTRRSRRPPRCVHSPLPHVTSREHLPRWHPVPGHGHPPRGGASAGSLSDVGSSSTPRPKESESARRRPAVRHRDRASGPAPPSRGDQLRPGRAVRDRLPGLLGIGGTRHPWKVQGNGDKQHRDAPRQGRTAAKTRTAPLTILMVTKAVETLSANWPPAHAAPSCVWDE